jgi:hypothetical protein
MRTPYQAAVDRADSAIKIYWPGPGVHAAWPALVQGEREHLAVLLTYPSASPAARGGSANPAPYRETAWLDGLASWRHSPAGKRFAVPAPATDSVDPAGKVAVTPRPLYTLLSALRGPGTHTRDPIHPDVSDIPGRRAVHGRKADIGTKIGAREPLEKFGRTSLGDAGSAIDDEVFVQAHGVARVGFEGERDTAVVADIAHLAVLGKVARHDLVPVQAHPYDAHLRAAVGVQGHKVRQGRGLEHGPGAAGQRGHDATLAASAAAQHRRAPPEMRGNPNTNLCRRLHDRRAAPVPRRAARLVLTSQRVRCPLRPHGDGQHVAAGD